jgi:hypothetical protein
MTLSLIEQIQSYSIIIKSLKDSQNAFDRARLRYCVRRRAKLLKKLSKIVDQEIGRVMGWKVMVDAHHERQMQ